MSTNEQPTCEVCGAPIEPGEAVVLGQEAEGVTLPGLNDPGAEGRLAMSTRSIGRCESATGVNATGATSAERDRSIPSPPTTRGAAPAEPPLGDARAESLIESSMSDASRTSMMSAARPSSVR